jgi:hypothetical protein
MRGLAVLPFVLLLAVGCSHRDADLLGQWNGGFEPESAPAGTPTRDLAMKGYIHIYLNENKFKLELSNRFQVLKYEGHWQRLTPKRIELRVDTNGMTVDEPDLDKMKAMGKPILDPDAIKAFYGKPLILDVGKDTLNGLLVTLGPMLGRHVFHRGE